MGLISRRGHTLDMSSVSRSLTHDDALTSAMHTSSMIHNAHHLNSSSPHPQHTSSTHSHSQTHPQTARRITKLNPSILLSSKASTQLLSLPHRAPLLMRPPVPNITRGATDRNTTQFASQFIGHLLAVVALHPNPQSRRFWCRQHSQRDIIGW